MLVQDKSILIDTLKVLSRDLQRQKFAFRSVIKQKNILFSQEKEISEKISEIRKRISYNINTHKKLLNSNE